jgi:acetyl esterase/lipase
MLRRAVILCAALFALAFAGTAKAASGWPVIDPSKLAPADPNYRVTVKPKGKTRGVVFAVHGGGWIGSTDLVDSARAAVPFLAKAGWRVELVGYRSGLAAFGDLERWHKRIRRSLPRRKPICAWGQSAGAHMSLLLAERLRFDCVIAEAGPTLLTETPALWDLPDVVHTLALRTFGLPRLVDLSPLIANRGMRTPTLLAHATNDSTVPVGQSRAYRDAIANVKLVELDPGLALFVHSPGVEPADLISYHKAAKRVLRRAEKRRLRSVS